MTNTVEFDPGIGNLADSLYSEAYVIENDMSTMPQRARKMRYFQAVYKRIVKVMLNNLAFYNGCLAWAYCIKNLDSEATISGNPFVSLTDEQKANYAPTDSVDFFIEYLPQFYSNLKYYNIKGVQLPENTDYILNTYREFVAVNEGFINAYKTADIILPDNVNFSKSAEDLKNEILSAVENKNILTLLSL